MDKEGGQETILSLPLYAFSSNLIPGEFQNLESDAMIRRKILFASGETTGTTKPHLIWKQEPVTFIGERFMRFFLSMLLLQQLMSINANL